MQKLFIYEKTLNAGASRGGFFGKSFTGNIFNLGLGLNMVSNIITNVTSMIAQDEYNNNPNPKYRLNSYDWNGSNFRIGPGWNRSAYSMIGGW